jgi:hypothetical protein
MEKTFVFDWSNEQSPLSTTLILTGEGHSFYLELSFLESEKKVFYFHGRHNAYGRGVYPFKVVH